MILLLVLMAIGAIALNRISKSGDRAEAAMHYWCDMGSLFHELRDDPFMTTEKWKEWLPLFEDADRRFVETHPYITRFTGYAVLVRREIDDQPLEEVYSP